MVWRLEANNIGSFGAREGYGVVMAILNPTWAFMGRYKWGYKSPDVGLIAIITCNN